MKYMLFVFVVGCSKSSNECLTTCTKIYEGCEILRPGASQDQLIDSCMEQCTNAMSTKGEVGDYNPYQKLPPSEKPELENKEQGALWMECVAETSCDLLEENYCSPIW